MKTKLVSAILVLALVLCTTGLAFAQDPGPVPVLPTLKLSVTQSPLTIYPPIMIYTAQLSFVPPITSARLVVDFYNFVCTSTACNSTQLEYLGSAPVDSTGKAVLYKQMRRGVYKAIAKTVINGNVIWSNIVDYKVP